MGLSWVKIQPPFLTSFFKLLPLSNKVITCGLRGRFSLWNSSELIESHIVSDENLLSALQLKNGQIILAGQRGRILISAPNQWVFRSLKISPEQDIASLIEVSDALIFVGEFGIVRIPKSDLDL